MFYVVKEKFDEILADHSIDAHFLLKKAKISFLKNIELMDPKMLDKMYISNKGIRVKNIWR